MARTLYSFDETRIAQPPPYITGEDMTIKNLDCSADHVATELVVTAGERLLYEISFVGGARANFAIVDRKYRR